MFFKKAKSKTFVIGLDGVPYTFLENYTKENNLSFFKKLFSEGSFIRMNSIYPTLSSVAWTSFLTGKKPGNHGIYGFIDIKDDLSLYIPNYRDIKTESILEILEKKGKRVLHINIPITYPPPEIKSSYCVSGFLCPSIEKAGYPAEVINILKEENYIIDLDPWMAREKEKREQFYKELFTATEKRIKVCEKLMKKENFDLILLHIMEPDRLLHFFINEEKKLLEYFKFLETELEKFIDKNINDGDDLVLLSDHGFTPLRKELNIIQFLKQKKALDFEGEGLKNIKENSLLFSLTPGRIYLFKKERFKKAKFSEKEIEKRIKDILKEISNLEGVGKLFHKEEVFGEKFIEYAPDYLFVPQNGYDLKADFKSKELFSKSALEGTHTYDDAFLFIRGKKLEEREAFLYDLAPTILSLMKINYKDNFDGKNLIK